jgi:hypothetical protein
MWLLRLLQHVSLLFALLQVRLMIIDEIHLLHDTRGPVLESIVARTIRWAARDWEGLDGLAGAQHAFAVVVRRLWQAASWHTPSG